MNQTSLDAYKDIETRKNSMLYKIYRAAIDFQNFYNIPFSQKDICGWTNYSRSTVAGRVNELVYDYQVFKPIFKFGNQTFYIIRDKNDPFNYRQMSLKEKLQELLKIHKKDKYINIDELKKLLE